MAAATRQEDGRAEHLLAARRLRVCGPPRPASAPRGHGGETSGVPVSEPECHRAEGRRARPIDDEQITGDGAITPVKAGRGRRRRL